MKYLFDSSVLIPALVKPHPMHLRSLAWLKKAKARKIDWTVASHSLAETYSVLTRLPLSPKISPTAAYRLVSENIPKEIITPLTVSDYLATLKELSASGLSGGVVYDALIARAAQKAKANRILTFNSQYFRRVWPQRERDIISP